MLDLIGRQNAEFGGAYNSLVCRYTVQLNRCGFELVRFTKRFMVFDPGQSNLGRGEKAFNLSTIQGIGSRGYEQFFDE